MPNWNEVLIAIKAEGSTHDIIRRRYLQKLHEKTDRNVIIYYSGWLQSPDPRGTFQITDYDKVGFMGAANNLDRSKGLDLVLHTPGGELAATESLVDYIHKLFNDVRVIVPQLALSAGTMIACSARSIVMGKQSSLCDSPRLSDSGGPVFLRRYCRGVFGFVLLGGFVAE